METEEQVQLPESYPVDMSSLDYDVLRINAEKYMSCLESNRPPENNYFVLSNGEKMKVTLTNVSRLSLFGDDYPKYVVLALHIPEDKNRVVALYLHGKWWALDDVLKTSSASRSGLVMVQSAGERVVLFLLSQIIFGILERSSGEETDFAPHPAKELAKILWLDGEATGFYTIKQKGSLCDGCTGQCYMLPVLDTVFIRRHWRRRGLALRMLEDFSTSFNKEEIIGISCPVSTEMYQVCRKYLLTNEEQRDRLYEVEGPGAWGQRRNVWLNMQLRGCPTD